VEKTGMDGEKAMAALTNPELVSTYEEEVREAVRKGITGVPHFEIYLRDRPGMKQAVSGAQPIETLIALFKRLRLLPKV
jgi:predicted DsbA family dithiol-disulfide isomerase